MLKRANLPMPPSEISSQFQAKAVARTPRVKAVVAGQKIIFELRPRAARPLPIGADAPRNIHTGIDRREPRVHLVQMQPESSALQDRATTGVGRILCIARAETVHVDAELNFIEAIVQAV